MELPAPITIYWDLPPEPCDDAGRRRICDGIIACKPLMLQVRHPGPRMGDATSALLERLATTRIAVQLTIPVEAFTAGPLPLGVKEVMVEIANAGEFEELLQHPMVSGVGVSFPLKDGNWRDLPQLAVACKARGIGMLALPMQRRYLGEPAFWLGPEEQGQLSRELSAVGGGEGFKLTVHDPFVWRAFYPKVPFPQGGCQAANTMLAIAPDGLVYPCPTLPEPLGDAAVTPLKEIIASATKREIRRMIREEPAGCRGCAELSVCRGGCRGRSYEKGPLLRKADPACSFKPGDY